MKFFIDTADTAAIKTLSATGLIDGVTTNPSLIAQSGRDFKTVIAEICNLVDGHVSAEVIATDWQDMVAEGQSLQAIAENVAVKLPMTLDGLRACRRLSDAGTAVNVTLCFSVNQALLAAKAGATYVSPFVGRLDDTTIDGSKLLEEIRCVYDNYDFATGILAASIRNANHVKRAALAGADVATMPPAILENLIKHPLTDKGLEAFLRDAQKSGVSV